MARSSTSERDLHHGLVERLRAGEAISTGDIPSHRLSTAAQKLRREGLEVLQEKVIENPGEFPAMVRSVYRVPASPPATNGRRSAPRSKARRGEVKATPDVRRRLLEGESLTAAQVASDYGCSNSILGQVVARLRSEGYLIDMKRKGSGPATVSCSAQPMGRKRKPKRPKWVEEAEEQEAAELEEPPDPRPRLRTMTAKRPGPAHCPRLLSVVWQTAVHEDGRILLTIRDDDEEFLAWLETQQP